MSRAGTACSSVAVTTSAPLRAAGRGDAADAALDQRAAAGGEVGLAGSYSAGIKAAREAGGKAARSAKPKVDASEGWSRGMLGAGPGAGPDTTVKAFVDFQNDVTAKDIRLAVREGMRSIEHVKRYTTNGMATDQGKTSNMQRPGDRRRRAGQSRSRGRPDHLPRRPTRRSTFGAFAGYARGRAVRPDAQDADRTPGPRRTARCSRMSASGSAPGTSRRAGEDMHAAVARECRDGAPVGSACSTPRRSARSRSSGPDAAEVHGAHVHQPLGEARARPLPLRPHAARGRLHLRRRRRRPPRAGPLPRDHDDRRRGARAQHDGGLSPDRMARPQGLADLDHRAMGGHRRAGAERAQDARAAGRRHRHVRRGACRTCRCAKARSAACRRGCSACRFTGELGFEVNVPADYGRAVWEALWADGPAARHLRLRHRGDARAARREGLHHRRPGHRRHGDARRRRARLGDRQGEAGLRRQARR